METHKINKSSLILIKAEINTLDPLDLRNSGIPYLIPELTRQASQNTVYNFFLFSKSIQVFI